MKIPQNFSAEFLLSLERKEKAGIFAPCTNTMNVNSRTVTVLSVENLSMGDRIKSSAMQAAAMPFTGTSALIKGWPDRILFPGLQGIMKSWSGSLKWKSQAVRWAA